MGQSYLLTLFLKFNAYDVTLIDKCQCMTLVIWSTHCAMLLEILITYATETHQKRTTYWVSFHIKSLITNTYQVFIFMMVWEGQIVYFTLNISTHANKSDNCISILKHEINLMLFPDTYLRPTFRLYTHFSHNELNLMMFLDTYLRQTFIFIYTFQS